MSTLQGQYGCGEAYGALKVGNQRNQGSLWVLVSQETI